MYNDIGLLYIYPPPCISVIDFHEILIYIGADKPEKTRVRAATAAQLRRSRGLVFGHRGHREAGVV